MIKDLDDVLKQIVKKVYDTEVQAETNKTLIKLLIEHSDDEMLKSAAMRIQSVADNRLNNRD